MIIKDRVLEVYPNSVSAELIVHTRHVTAVTPEGLAAACMKDVDLKFHEKLEKGKILVAGNNFGCNSSREWAPAALLYSGVRLIVAQSFSRIFFRSAINIGLNILECKNITQIARMGDELEVDITTGAIKNLTTGEAAAGTVLPEFLLDIMVNGGLLKTLESGKK